MQRRCEPQKLECAIAADAATATTLREVKALREVHALAVASVRQEISQAAEQLRIKGLGPVISQWLAIFSSRFTAIRVT